MSDYEPSSNPHRLRDSTIFPGVRRIPPQPDPPTVLTCDQTQRLSVRRRLARSGARPTRDRSASPPHLPTTRARARTRSRSPTPPPRPPPRSPPTGRTRIRPVEYRNYSRHLQRYGLREQRTEPLTEDDLYVGRVLPTVQSTDAATAYLQCGICLNAKSHPVSYACGHSHCYACIRLSLEKTFKCPECKTRMRAPPHRQYTEEHAIAKEFPEWKDPSRVLYDFSGLYFPKGLPVVDSSDEEV
ncbi:hypothetical protein B0H11DRAFT_2242701 [Mycena galericulata]|nr:hypothetical protein B0H11DRAFT_2242701 [Mycena galericulata]